LIYHDIFSFPLRRQEISRWKPGKLRLRRGRPQISDRDGFVYLKGREHLIEERLKREQISKQKAKILSTFKEIFENDKFILMVGITGSLAMASAGEDSDIDLLLITKSGKLWTTRLKTLLRLKKMKVVRSPKSKYEKDKLCLNMWMDEFDLVIDQKNRNAYTAHEVAQIVPLVNKENTYKRLLALNSWVLDYWPNAVQIQNSNLKIQNQNSKLKAQSSFLIEKAAYLLQRTYMARKITREVVTPTRAFFHPFDWSRKVAKELEDRGVVEAG